MADRQRNIPALVAKLKAENDCQVVIESFMELVAALRDDPTYRCKIAIAQAGGIRASFVMVSCDTFLTTCLSKG